MPEAAPSPIEKEPSRLRQYAEERQAIDALFQQALRTQGGAAAFMDFCNFLRRFRRYSLYNGMLIRMQRPGAQAVATIRQWRKQGRSVNPDAVPIITLRPFGPTGFVYELGDTAGPPLPGSDYDSVSATGDLAASTWERTVALATAAGIAVEVVANYGSGLAGTAAALHRTANARTDAANDEQIRWRVRINGALDRPSRYLTLAHELAHIYCGHLGGDRTGRWPDRRGLLTPAQQELEAEAAAHLVGIRAELDTRSAAYVALFVGLDDLDAISLYAVIAAADRIEARGHAASR